MNSANNPVPITARSVEGIQRIAEAHARMRLSDEITFADVDAAKKIIIYCLKMIAVDDQGRLDANLL